MPKRREIYVVLDRGTPQNPVVAVYNDYRVAEDQAAKLNAANSSTEFMVSIHAVQSEGAL